MFAYLVPMVTVVKDNHIIDLWAAQNARHMPISDNKFRIYSIYYASQKKRFPYLYMQVL